MIYLPIEVPKRDLIGKTLLGCYLANKNVDVVIFEHTFFDRYMWIPKSIYIGKNCFRTEVPHNLEFYNKMKKKNIRVFFLDDEGAVYPAKDDNEYSKMLQRRFDQNIFQKDDKIFTWGKFQKQFYDSKKTKSKVINTGYPPFEFLKKKYHSKFVEFDKIFTSGLSNFVLITTRFGEINPQKKFDYYIGENSGTNNSFSEKIDQLKEKGILLPYYLEAINELSKNYKEIKFIIRPHPEENKDIYNVLFAKHKNIIVSNNGPVESWIRLSKMVISYGCTTLLQAQIAEKISINYEPEIIKFSNNNINVFVNDFGIKATNLKELKNRFNSLLEKNTNNTFNHINKLNLNNTLESIKKEIPINNYKNSILLLTFFGKFENLKFFVRNLFNKTKFDEDNLFSLNKKIVNLGEKIFDKKFKVINISKKVFIIRKIN